jgi:aryl-alcohol dehydrogenase-like predicted oxidoreductase
MKTRKIGPLEVSIIGVGCNNFGRRIDEKATKTVVDAAIDAGINFFDTADIYGNSLSEQYLGSALGKRRAEVVVATKFGMSMGDNRRGAHPDYIRQAAEDSLRRLGTDYIDLYQLHEPDPEVPIADTLGALDELVRAGKVRQIGCSNFSVAQIREAEASAADKHTARFISVQNEYSLLHREPDRGVLAECARVGAAFLPFFPLASGLLTGKYHRGEPAPAGARLTEQMYAKRLNEADLDRVEALRGYAHDSGHTLLELAFSWLLAKPVVASVIAGATKPEQISSNAAAADWELTKADLDAIDGIVPVT